jgi:sugar (pentulose or hexulose) kinase
LSKVPQSVTVFAGLNQSFSIIIDHKRQKGAGVPEQATIVIDIGKTIAKASLWSAGGALIDRQSRANAVCDGALDADGIEGWLAETLSNFAKLGDVGAIIPVAHGAAAVLINDGRLACPPRDYEALSPDGLRADYEKLRAPFAETGSPALPHGLNLGAQLFAQQAQITGQILLWPQYWSWLLSGVASSEVTSLGCHTDLWNPGTGDFSSLAKTMGWAERFPSLRRAGDVLGPMTPEWAARTGLPADTLIHCGVHDSNAALVATRGFGEIAGSEATLLSTGTWFVAMRAALGAVDLAALPEARDCLVNVDVEGCPIPSARFMGGREIEMLSGPGGIDCAVDQAAIAAAIPDVIAERAMILPSFAAGCGPFPDGRGRWINEPRDPDARKAATALYASLVADTALDLIGARRTLLIEGRFARADAFVRALATLRPETTVYTSIAEADVAFGALRLVHPSITPGETLTQVKLLAADFTSYKADWHRQIEEGNAA